MIVLNVTYKCKPEMREEFLEMIFARLGELKAEFVDETVIEKFEVR